MKKSCALALAAFYMVITTSVYTCLVHCTAKYLFSTLGIEQQIHQSNKDRDKDEKDNDDDHNCSNPYRFYAAQKNFNSSFGFQFAIIHAALVQLKSHCFFYIPERPQDQAGWTPANGPPLYI
jgi:hypothetical protein